MSDYPMLISNKLHSFRNFALQIYSGIFIATTLQCGHSFCANVLIINVIDD